jgi:hypothetical protein
MRTRAFIVIAVAALALAGCGKHNLVLKVDVLSYLDDSQRSFSVEAVPAVGELGTIPIVSDMTIRLIEGLDHAAEARSATLSLGGQVSVDSGSGSGRFRLYLSDGDTPPLDSAPVMDVPVTFAAGAPAIINAETAGSPEVARLFTHKDLHLAMALDSVTIVSSVTHMTVTIGKFEVIVLAGRKNTF